MLNATLTQRIDLTPEAYIFQVTPDSGFKPFLPGQYVAIGLPREFPRPENFPPEATEERGGKLTLRTYSISSTPDAAYLEFYIITVPTGGLTPRLSVLKPGDRLYVAPKIAGTFNLHDVPKGANLIFVSTGTGIAPFVSMLRTPATWANAGKISVIHGVRFPEDLGFRAELEELAQHHNNFNYYPIVSRANDSWDGKRGYVQSILFSDNFALNPEHDHLFLCGNPTMIEEVESKSIGLGYQLHSKHHPGSLHVEKYW